MSTGEQKLYHDWNKKRKPKNKTNWGIKKKKKVKQTESRGDERTGHFNYLKKEKKARTWDNRKTQKTKKRRPS